MEKVKILEPFEYIRNETPEEFEEEEKNERWADRIDGAGMFIGGGLGTLLKKLKTRRAKHGAIRKNGKWELVKRLLHRANSPRRRNQIQFGKIKS